MLNLHGKLLITLSAVSMCSVLLLIDLVYPVYLITVAIAIAVVTHLSLFILLKQPTSTHQSIDSANQASQISKYKLEQQAILQTIVDALIIIDERGRITQINPSCIRLLGYSEAELIGNNVSMLMAESLGKHHDQYIRNYLESGDAKIIGIGREVKARHKDGHSLPVHLAISKYKDDHEYKFVGVLRDISEEVSLREKLVKEATHDQLTGLATRRKLEEFVNMLVSSSQRADRLFAILFIDLNKFKPINDLYGHATGDAVLKSVAQRIARLTRKEDLCSRIGGDEFVVVISELGALSKLQLIISRYENELSKNVTHKGSSIAISASIGSATFPSDGGDYLSLMQCADQDMYQQKDHHIEVSGSTNSVYTRRSDESINHHQLYSLSYISMSSVPKEEVLNELNDIKVHSENNNSDLQITGKLLFKNGYFLQRLEGSKENLDICFRRIKRDVRHQNIILLHFDKIPHRQFNNWSQMPIISLNGTSDGFDKLVLESQEENFTEINDATILRIFNSVISIDEVEKIEII